MGPRGDALLTIRGWIGSKDVGAVLTRSRLGPLRPAGSEDLAFRRRQPVNIHRFRQRAAARFRRSLKLRDA